MLFVSQKLDRGGSIYEEQVRKIVEKLYNVEVLEITSKKNKLLPFTKLKYYYQVNSYKPGKEYDIVVANKASVYAGILRKKAQKKILIFHHYSSEENSYPIVKLFLKKSILSSLNNFDRIVVVSEYWKKFVGNYADPSRIHIAYNSFDTAAILQIKNAVNKIGVREKLGIPNDKIIVYAGSALKVKGYTKVLELLAGEKYFVITSGGNDAVKPLTHLHLSLNYETYIQLLCAVDVTVILTSFQEGWNRIAHESLICGTPVIGTNMAGMGELMQKAGQVIYREGDNLEDLIKKCLENNAIAAKGMEYALQFNLQYFEDRWKAILT